MNRSVAAACILGLLVLCLGVELLNLPTALSILSELALILTGALIGSKVKRR
jgi:hypothetical protein